MQPQRRSYSKSFKAQVVQECAQPGASIARVAQHHSLKRTSSINGFECKRTKPWRCNLLSFRYLCNSPKGIPRLHHRASALKSRTHMAPSK
ncbi:transposase [Pseudomonas sp. ADAK2]|nr:transposase [Pseudomonas sp. ADAK7]QJI47379.1 transposase [Pseudomonas sp. ADAK2]